MMKKEHRYIIGIVGGIAILLLNHFRNSLLGYLGTTMGLVLTIGCVIALITLKKGDRQGR